MNKLKLIIPPHATHDTDEYYNNILKIDNIEPYLYLTGLDAIRNESYKTFSIGKVISILGTESELASVRDLLPINIDHVPLLLLDDGVADIQDYFEPISNEIKTGVDNKVPTLIHCSAGVSRSVTLTAAHLCITRGLDYNEALNYIKDKRSVCNPNFGFISKLANKFPKVNQ